jgi:hypothetical protein
VDSIRLYRKHSTLYFIYQNNIKKKKKKKKKREMIFKTYCVPCFLNYINIETCKHSQPTFSLFIIYFNLIIEINKFN